MPNMYRSYTYKSFQWSRQEFCPRTLLEHFGHQMPFLILVTQGYMGRDEGLHMIAADEFYWLHSVCKQERIVVKDLSDEKYYSIPLSYTDEVIPVQSNGVEGASMTIADMYKAGKYRYIRFSSRQTICEGADQVDYKDLGELQVMDTYQERFLVAHTVLSHVYEYDEMYRFTGKKIRTTEGLYPKCTILPVYMPIGIAIGVTMENGDKDRFARTMMRFRNYADQQDHSCCEAIMRDKAQDIMRFDSAPSDGDYEYIHFLQFIKHNKDEGNIDRDGYWSVNDLKSSPARPVRGQAVAAAAACDSDSDYEDIGTCTQKRKPEFSMGIEQTPVDQRVDIVSLDLDPFSVIAEMHNALITGDIPDIHNEDECDLKEDPVQERRPFVHKPKRELKVPDRAPPPLPGESVTGSPSSPTTPTNKGQRAPPPPIPPTATPVLAKSLPPPAQRGPATKSLPSPKQVDPGTPGHPSSPLGAGVNLAEIKRNLKPSQNSAILTGRDSTSAPIESYQNVSPSAAPTTGKPMVKEKPKPEPTNNPIRTVAPNQKPGKPKFTVVGDSVQITSVEPKAGTGSAAPAPIPKTPVKPKAAIDPKTAAPGTQRSVARVEPQVQTTEARSDDDTPSKDTKYSFVAKSVSEIPLNIEEFSISDIGRCLELLNLSQYKEQFEAEQIDGQLLKSLSKDDLKQAFNCSGLVALKLAMFAKGTRIKDK